MEQKLADETREYLQAIDGNSGGDRFSWQKFLGDSQNRLSSPDDIYSGLPKAIRKIERTQNTIDHFVSNYYGTVSMIFDRAKASLARVFGINYSPKGLDDVMSEQAGYVREAEQDFEMLVDHAESVLEHLISYQAELASGRAQAVEKLSSMRTDIEAKDRINRDLSSAIQEVNIGSPEYHQLYKGITKLARQRAEAEVASVQASRDLAGYHGNLEVINSVVEIAGKGLKEAALAKSEFQHTAELLEGLIPYFALSEDFGADRRWVLEDARRVQDSVRRAIGLSFDAFGTLDKLSAGATLYALLPATLADGMRAFSKQRDNGVISSSYAEADSILAHKGL
ncbi:MAG: hypothetical protein EPN86_05430 [Nanoarchaeota archaeon]|nr:MAG: hypothetical protein EPN86_05430 [Nanoarchaeota archaeon]